MLITKPVNEFLDELASNSPAPGGGSVAALSGAIGAALISMVGRLTIGKKKYADVQATMEDVVKKSEELRGKFSKLLDEDTAAFNEVMAALSLPKSSEEEQRKRSATIQEATKKATLVPLNVMQLCEQALHLAKTTAEKGNKNSVSDAGVAVLMLQSACAGAALNVRINLGSLEDQAFVRETSVSFKKILGNVEMLSRATLEQVEKSLG
ncbi:MAG: cyclodeaminase/cyclohydrolase family protein [Ignavibacteriales bacterium]|nr:cyclodeaminase/cyclohydrolase family protein [Ignavibacteriales bacterium]